MLNQIKTLLSIKVKLEEAKLENGTIISADSFEKGSEVFIVTDDEKVALPVGEYILEDGRLLVVSEEGIINDVKSVSDEVPAEVEAEEEEEVKEEVSEDLEEGEEKDDIIDFKALKERIQNLEDAISDLKEKKDLEESEEVEEELKEEVKEELSKEELSKEELSNLEPASKPIKHSPESGSKQKNKIEFAKGKFNSPLERVLNKLNK